MLRHGGALPGVSITVHVVSLDVPATHATTTAPVTSPVAGVAAVIELAGAGVPDQLFADHEHRRRHFRDAGETRPGVKSTEPEAPFAMSTSAMPIMLPATTTPPDETAEPVAFVHSLTPLSLHFVGLPCRLLLPRDLVGAAIPDGTDGVIVADLPRHPSVSKPSCIST